MKLDDVTLVAITFMPLLPEIYGEHNDTVNGPDLRSFFAMSVVSCLFRTYLSGSNMLHNNVPQRLKKRN